MSTNRATIEAETNTVRGPWGEPLRASLPATVPQTDPRLELTDQALVVASQNAYPIVATQKSRRDNMGLAAGAAIALVLGCATFVSLNSGRHASVKPSASTAVTQRMTILSSPPASPPTRPAAPFPSYSAPPKRRRKYRWKCISVRGTQDIRRA